MSESVGRMVRHAKKASRLGRGARCAQCGETDPRALQVTEVVLCAECRLRLEGKPIFENHHIAGRRNDTFSIPIPANDHALLSDDQTDWPRETLKNPQGDILHLLAAWLRGIHDLLRLWAERVEGWALVLEELARYLAEKLGAAWWNGFEQHSGSLG